jgi:excinuclease ABC subunit A
MQKNIVIKGAREHNLKNINVTLPRNKCIVITGLSGSGKSTLAFDTIYAEGQRRYVESLSAYARQFLGLMNKPDIDSIEGLSPAISIEQKTTSKNPRSTVGTVTEIYDYLRLLFARIGTPYCPKHNLEIEKKSPQKVTESILQDRINEDILVLAPIISQKKGTHEKIIEDLKKEGFVRARVNKKIIRTDEKIKLERYKKHDIEAVIDRLNTKDSQRLLEAVENALKKGGQKIIILKDKKDNNEKMYSSSLSCPKCDISFEELQPRMFSFNSPFGACPECNGLGIKQEIDPQLVIPDNNLCIADGAVAAYRNHVDGWRSQQLASVAKSHGFGILTPIKDLSKNQLNALFYGSDKEVRFKYTSKKSDASFTHNGYWEGVIPQLQRLYKHTESDYRKRIIEKFMRIDNCNTCKGKRLKEKVLTVKINKRNIIDVTDLSIDKCMEFFLSLKLNSKEKIISKQVLKEINSRLKFLHNVGLSYLTLSRSAGTLSGGEAQRIRLATQIGSNLTGVLYILDEPSIGLHQRDNNKLIETLHHLRDLGNTLIIVEHDEDTIRKSDYIVDMGPGSGIHGGRIIAKGTPLQIEQNKNSLTGQYLSKKLTIEVPNKRRTPKSFIEIKHAKENNLKNLDVKIPTGVLTLVTGVSGSGKSTLIYQILYKALMQKLYKSKTRPGKHSEIIIPNEIDKVIMVDQSPIGKTPRSNPATYIKVFDEIRQLFSMTKEARLRGYKPGRFSFNVKGGRCEACEGDGEIKIEMNFLPDVYVTCEECKGKRFNKDTLEVTYKGKNIAEILDMSVEEALSFFTNLPSINRKIETLNDVGLGYIKLGQSSVTLSGGEAQRIKLTKELAKKSSSNTLYLLDEPTTGLHFHDTKKLISVLNRLVDKGNSIIVIEHNLDVIKTADYILDLGPEGGTFGGAVIANGTPEQIVKNQKSHTGRFLKPLL